MYGKCVVGNGRRPVDGGWYRDLFTPVWCNHMYRAVTFGGKFP